MSSAFSAVRLTSVRELLPTVAKLVAGREVPRSLQAFFTSVVQPQIDLPPDRDTVREIVFLLHQLACWYQAGLPIFRPTHDLLAALLLTDPAGVPAAEVQRPYNTFVVEFPSDWPWTISDSIGNACPVRLAWIHTYDPMHADSAGFQIQIVAEGASDVRTAARLAQQGAVSDVALYDRLPDLVPSTNLGAWLNFQSGKPLAFGLIPSLARDASDFHIQAAMRRLYVNLCLYIAEKGKGKRLPQAPGRKRKSKRLAAVAPRPEVWILGTEIHLPAQLKDSAHAWTESRRGQKLPWKVQKRFTVRGHWRLQAHGKARQERKRIWITPYWKGPAEGVRLAHLYNVKRTTE